jgi:hypothetical protein
LVLANHSQRLATPLSTRERRTMRLVGVALLVAAIAVGTWIATHNDGPVSRKGCINVAVAGSLGGVLLHRCGAQARSLCAGERSHPDVIASVVLPACRRAGIATGRRPSAG